MYQNHQKLEVLRCCRLRCSDGSVVARLGAAKVFGIDKKLITDWGHQEEELVKFCEKTPCRPKRQRSNHGGPRTFTNEVEETAVDEIITLINHGAAVTSDIVMAKLLAEKPNFSGRLPSPDQQRSS